MIMPTTEQTPVAPRAYTPPVLVVLGSVEAITKSSNNGSINDFKGRENKH